MNRIVTAIFCLSMIMFSACDDDFLDIESTDLTDDVIWSDPALAESYILSLYTSIRLTNREAGIGAGDGASAGLTRGFFWAMFSSVTDETVYSNDDDTYTIQRGEMSPNNFGFVGTAWGRHYRGIRECNVALARIPDLELPDQSITELLAEVRFIRAFRYVQLLRSYGGVPIMQDATPGLEDDFSDLYDRSTVNETVAYINGELDFAIANLPSKASQETGRANMESAMGLRSRLLLIAASPLFTDGAPGLGTNNGLNGGSTTTWQEAANAADQVMALGTLSLVDNLDTDPVENYRLFFLQDQTQEDLLIRDYNANSRAFGGLEKMNAPNSLGGWAGNGPMQNFVDDFEMSNGLPIDDPASGYDPDDPYTDRDPRFYATVVYDGANLRGSILDITVDAGTGQNLSRTGYFMRKFIDEGSDLNDWDNTGREASWRYIRYAEILLNFAEAQNEANGPTAPGSQSGMTPLQAVNMVRNRAGMPDLPGGISQDDLRQRIRNERRIELFMEEHRYYDVRRWLIAEQTEGIPARKVVRTATGYDFTQPADNMGPKTFRIQNYWVPIPINDITISEGRIVQNPNY